MDIPQSPEDLVQLIPATGWYAVYREGNIERSYPLVAFGLTRAGDVEPLDIDPLGSVENVAGTSNLIRIEYKEPTS